MNKTGFLLVRGSLSHEQRSHIKSNYSTMQQVLRLQQWSSIVPEKTNMKEDIPLLDNPICAIPSRITVTLFLILFLQECT